MLYSISFIFRFYYFHIFIYFHTLFNILFFFYLFGLRKFPHSTKMHRQSFMSVLYVFLFSANFLLPNSMYQYFLLFCFVCFLCVHFLYYKSSLSAPKKRHSVLTARRKSLAGLVLFVLKSCTASLGLAKCKNKTKTDFGQHQLKYSNPGLPLSLFALLRYP